MVLNANEYSNDKKHPNDAFSGRKEDISQALNTNTFIKYIESSGIGSTDNLIKGTYMLLPYGKKIFDNIQNNVKNVFENLGYEEVMLPTILPEQYVQHLRQDGLFSFNDTHGKFFLPAAYETLLAASGMNVFKHQQNLPVKIYSINRAFRSEPRIHRFVKNTEFYSFELTALFKDFEAIAQEETIIHTSFQQLLNKLDIQYIQVNDRKDMSGQNKTICYFQFSGKFGTAFCSNMVGNKYFQNIKGYEGLDMLQLCGTSTDRLLPLYLGSHMDDKGFILDKGISPYDIFIHANDSSDIEVQQLQQFFDKNEIRYLNSHDEKYTNSYDKFLVSGIPFFIGAGKWEFKMLNRSNNESEWIRKDLGYDVIKDKLSDYTIPSNHPFDVKYEQAPLESEQYKENSVYIFPQDLELAVIKKTPNLKKLGYITIPMPGVVFVQNKY